MNLILKLGACLIFGVVLTLLVATCSLLILPHQLHPPPGTSDNTDATFVDIASDATLSVATFALYPRLESSDAMDAVEQRAIGAPAWISTAMRLNNVRDLDTRLNVVAAGWPLRSVVVVMPVGDFTTIRVSDDSDAGRQAQAVGAMQSSPEPTWAQVIWEDLATSDAKTRIELFLSFGQVGIHSPGLVLSSLLFAVLGWLAVRGLRTMRSYMRCRRGLCSLCGYPAAAGSTCSECGHPGSNREIRSSA